jgi:hypothetical protein
MFNGSKSPFRSFAAAMGLTNEDEAAAATSRRLHEMLADMEDGDRMREAQRAEAAAATAAAATAVQEAPAADEHEPDEQPPEEAVAVLEPVATETHVPVPVRQEPRPASPTTLYPGEFSGEAQKLAAQQREAAERLLHETRMLEERITMEAEIARAVRAQAEAKERAESAVQDERRAREAAENIAQRKTTVANQVREAEDRVATCRSGADAAKAQIDELERLLQDAQRLYDETLVTINAQKERIEQSKAQQLEIEADAVEVATQLASSRAAREKAEVELKAAQNRVEDLRKSQPAQINGEDSAESVRSLAMRIAEQAAVLKRGGANGVAA